MNSGGPFLALGTFSLNGDEPFPGIVVEDRVVDLRPLLGDDVTTRGLLEAWAGDMHRMSELAARENAGLPLASVRSHAPVSSRQILCAGANYRRHVREMAFGALKGGGDPRSDDELRDAARQIAEDLSNGPPFIFAGLPSALAGAEDDVVLWGPGTQHDWELELAVVIGRGGRNIPRDRAMEHVAGYTISNDISTRDMLTRPGFPMSDLVMTKSRPTFFPTGPYIVPRHAVSDHRQLRIRLQVNGTVMQDELVDDLMHDIDSLVAYASTAVELYPGDLLLTGSPAGNAGHHGSRWLRPGDVIEGEIAGLGTQRNRCVAPGS
jgi:2-keto-4-pentenoate hydratase/2-oxohepta-3-ene-1,7-dioic acid hydratase in catechol pathway